MKMEASTAPSSSSNHVVLERLNGVKTGVDKKMETGDLPSIGDDDIHNVIGSCKIFLISLYLVDTNDYVLLSL